MSLGRWGPVFDLQNVAIHTHLLPTGKVLYWGRRSRVGDLSSFASLNEHSCSTFLWDPATGSIEPTAQAPQLDGGESVNLFCSGHTFLPDGRLLVVGGHLFDNEGVNQACVYDPFAKTWTALPRMNNGRWYPSALALPDGGVLVISGCFTEERPQPPPDNPTPPPIGTKFYPNIIPQIWRGNAWAPTVNFNTLSLYPRLHIEPKQGRVFMAGPQGESYFLDIAGAGTWTPGPARDRALRDYAPSVMYESGKILFIGGGQDPDPNLPTNVDLPPDVDLPTDQNLPTNLAETIDLNVPVPLWVPTQPMNFRRRQHNATVLPDGTVLVTGGTQGIKGSLPWETFNNLSPGAPVHEAELWNPATRQWTTMAAERVDRCYHSTALLLPDGRVLSAGGGEYDPKNPADHDEPKPNPPEDSHQDAQLFYPPYLDEGPRPTISNAPTEITYGESFNVIVGAFDRITKVSWIRLGSVTHSCNQSQLLNSLEFSQEDLKVTVQAPLSANIAPPGHYMLFVLNAQGVPSIAPIVRIAPPPIMTEVMNAVLSQGMPAAVPVPVNLMALNRKITTDHGRPPVVVGITPSCPYGIGACWGGAFDALQRLSNIKVVRPVPSAADSVAFVYLQRDILPDLSVWRNEFAKIVNGTYVMRGIEMTLSGSVTKQGTTLTLARTATPTELLLAPLREADKIQWDIRKRANRPMSEEEKTAFNRLSETLEARRAGATVQVTGPLKKDDHHFFLEVREFEIGPD